jgi:hypothetical protein
MKAPSIALLALALTLADAQFYPTAPVGDSVWTKGTTQTIEWKKQLTEAAGMYPVLWMQRIVKVHKPLSEHRRS